MSNVTNVNTLIPYGGLAAVTGDLAIVTAGRGHV